MSRAQELKIEDQASTIAGLREKVARLQGELQGERRGEYRVAEQLAADVRQSALREDQQRQAAVRAVSDVRRLMRLVAGHILELRAGADSAQSAELLVDELTLAGFSASGAIVNLQAERADAVARTHAHMSASALADAAVPPRAH